MTAVVKTTTSRSFGAVLNTGCLLALGDGHRCHSKPVTLGVSWCFLAGKGVRVNTRTLNHPRGREKSLYEEVAEGFEYWSYEDQSPWLLYITEEHAQQTRWCFHFLTRQCNNISKHAHGTMNTINLLPLFILSHIGTHTFLLVISIGAGCKGVINTEPSMSPGMKGGSRLTTAGTGMRHSFPAPQNSKKDA